MKKLICLAIAAIMILSMIPVMAISTSAAEVEGDWTVYRHHASYAEQERGEVVRPNVGYEYVDGEGLVIKAPDWTNYTPYFALQTKEAWNLKEGFYMEVRVDEFTIKDAEGAYVDHWVSFNLSDRENIELGGSAHGNNWCCLVRNEDGGTVRAVDGFSSHWTTMTTDETVGSFATLGMDPSIISISKDDQGRDIFTFEVSWDGSAYTLKVNGAVVPGNAQITEKLEALNTDGTFYPGIAFNSAAKDGTVSCTLVKYGNSAEDATTPVGSDSLAPEDNMLVFGDPIDPATVPANTPVLMWDATKTSFKNDPTGVNMALTAQGDDSYHLEVVGAAPYFQWSIKSELTANQSDFPVFAMLMKDFWGTDGGIYYCAGDVMGASDNYKTSWGIYDEGCQFYGEDGEYILVVVDLAALELIDETNSGRIHSIRPYFSVTDTTDLEACQWDMCYMGYFRSIEEAQAYTSARLSMEPETEAPTEAPTDAPETSAPETNAPETNAPEQGGDATQAPETEAPAKEGCGSVIGFSAVAIMAAAAAAVALKKKD